MAYRDSMKEITDQLEQGVKDIFSSGRYTKYLNTLAKFHQYSLNNTLLIAAQRPDATYVAVYNAWQRKFGRHVLKGEKGIKIIAPATVKESREQTKMDPVTKKTVLGRDGKPVTEQVEVTIPLFKVVTVFDVSQTDGKPLPTLGVAALDGSVAKYNDLFDALVQTSPVPMGFEHITSGAKGYYHLEDKRIAIHEGMSQLQTVKTAIHELAHAKLHDSKALKELPAGQRPDRRTREVQAESVAYTVCRHYGLDTSDYSFAYITGWSSGRDVKELKVSMETIRAASSELITGIDAQLLALEQSRVPQLAGQSTDVPVTGEKTPLRDKLQEAKAASQRQTNPPLKETAHKAPRKKGTPELYEVSSCQWFYN